MRWKSSLLIYLFFSVQFFTNWFYPYFVNLHFSINFCYVFKCYHSSCNCSLLIYMKSIEFVHQPFILWYCYNLWELLGDFFVFQRFAISYIDNYITYEQRPFYLSISNMNKIYFIFSPTAQSKDSSTKLGGSSESEYVCFLLISC